jgi:hypothetical protein
MITACITWNASATRSQLGWGFLKIRAAVQLLPRQADAPKRIIHNNFTQNIWIYNGSRGFVVVVWGFIRAYARTISHIFFPLTEIPETFTIFRVETV